MGPVVLVGAGMAGYAVARALRQSDASMPLQSITRDAGAVYAKPALSNAFAHGRDARQMISAGGAQAGAGLGINLPFTPVVVKTPSCALALARPAAGLDGTWQYDTVDGRTVARFVDAGGTVHGWGSAGDAAGNRAGLAGLQKKMTVRMKELEEASKDMSPGAKERIKLLQMQIQACEMQIQQLQADAAQRALLKKDHEAPDGQAVATVEDVTSPPGSKIDTRA